MAYKKAATQNKGRMSDKIDGKRAQNDTVLDKNDSKISRNQIQILSTERKSQALAKSKTQRQVGKNETELKVVKRSKEEREKEIQEVKMSIQNVVNKVLNIQPLQFDKIERKKT